jgi:hypothetical protein
LLARFPQLRALLGKPPDAVISFPKSGRTWLRVMLDELSVPMSYTHAGSGHSRAKHFSELDTTAARHFRRIVFLHRDPRDTVVSGYYQVDRRLGKNRGTLSEFIRDPRHGIEKVTSYNTMWLALAGRDPRLLAVSYEQLKSDAVDWVRRILDFLGQTRDTTQIAEVVARCTFSRMQQREREGSYKAQYGHILAPGESTDPDSYKIRRGVVGGYKDELSAEDIAFCNQVLKARGLEIVH